MKINLPQPKFKVFAWFPIWMGQDWRWLEFIEVRYSMFTGVPMLAFGVIDKRGKHEK